MHGVQRRVEAVRPSPTRSNWREYVLLSLQSPTEHGVDTEVRTLKGVSTSSGGRKLNNLDDLRAKQRANFAGCARNRHGKSCGPFPVAAANTGLTRVR
jgi:hypothetical protein